MPSKHGIAGLLLALPMSFLLHGCGEGPPMPTGPTPLPSLDAPLPGATGLETLPFSDVPTVTDNGPLPAATEEFNCTNLQERFVRFSSPGFVDGNRVGLYYNFVGVPAGPATLEVFWDEENAPGVSQRFDLGDGEIQRDDDTRSDHTGLVEHAYQGLLEPTQRVVRANLIAKGRTGNCATVRHIQVSPAPASSGSSPEEPLACRYAGTFANHDTQQGRIFRDATPSSCPGKAYPGIFNPGTPYYYEVFDFVAAGVGPVCLTVDFDPNVGSTPCGTNAHASAYTATYDPSNQSAGFLGDVGSSITDSFSFSVTGGSAFQVVVTNTSAQQSCNFSFTVSDTACR